MSNLKIVISINYLAVGGTQTFAFALAEGLAKRGHKIYIYNFNLPFSTKSLKNLHSPLLNSSAFQLVEFRLPALLGLHELLTKFRPLETLLTWYLNRIRVIRFKKFILAEKIDLVNSHLMASDTLSSFAIQDIPAVTHCATMHGSYEGFPKAAKKEKREIVFSRVNGIIYLSPKNIEFLCFLKRKNTHLKLRQIYNGYLPHLFDEAGPKIGRQNLNIDENAFVFIQVARGTMDKGWEETIQAFLSVQCQVKLKTNLLLVGDGPYIAILKNKYKDQKDVFFYGYSGNPIPLIQLSDVGMLPSYYKGESLPNTVIEYLFAGKPVLASDIGEITAMIGAHGASPCGFTLKLDKGKGVNAPVLAEKMMEYINNKELYALHAKNTAIQREKFKMENCAAAYESFFSELRFNKTNLNLQ